MITKPNLSVNNQRISKLVGGFRLKGLFKASTLDKPLIPIIKVVFNGEKFLKEISVFSLGALSFGDPFSKPVLNYRQFV